MWWGGTWLRSAIAGRPIRQGVRQTHGGYAPKIALGLGLRMDRGPQYTARQILGELRWLGIRTLKEECVYLHDFATLEEARQVIGEFIERYNREWLLERHSYRTPADAHAHLKRDIFPPRFP